MIPWLGSKKILVLQPNLVGWITFYHSRVCYIQWTGLREHLNRKPTGNLHFFPLNLGLSDIFSVKPIHLYTSHHARILFFSGPSSKLTSYGTSPCLVKHRTKCALASIPICSMYGIFTYIWVIIRANVGKYTIHGAYGYKIQWLRGRDYNIPVSEVSQLTPSCSPKWKHIFAASVVAWNSDAHLTAYACLIALGNMRFWAN